MTFAFDGAIATSTRPHGAAGRPFAVLIDVHVLPPSVDRWSPEPLVAVGPSPPERNVQPLRRKSHSPASRASGFVGSMARLEQPVDALLPFRICDHVLPPSIVL